MTIHETQGGRAAARRAAQGKGAPPPSRRRQKPRKRLKRVLMGVGAFVILVAGLGVAWIYQLNGNIRHGALDTGAGPQKGSVIPGVLNILVIGSDTRNSSTDAKLGGSDNSLPHADVEMLVHVAANHDNATVLSIPRDTDVQMPTCQQNGKTYVGKAHDQITNSLNYGPGCTVAAVNSLTGVHIDHYMVVDFSGVVNMSDAVGGVSVCVNNNVYDPASGLKLAKGTHTLQGQAALEFLRTRHGFGNGGDVERTVAQHVYLSALIRKMKSAGTLANPANVFSLAEAGTKAFAVDDGLAGVTQLVSLANTLGQIPTDHITFATMPVINDPFNPTAWVAPGPGSTELFQAIANDQSLTPTKASSSPKPSAAAPTSSAPAAAPAVAPASVPIHVLNGTGVTGRASEVQTKLTQLGYTDTVTGNTTNVASTKVEYSTASPVYKEEAQQVASALGLPSSALDPNGVHSSIYLLVGPDLAAGGGNAPSSKPSVNVGAATANAQTENAASPNACAQVNTFPLGSLPPSMAQWNGLSVERAYAIATRKGIPDSAK